MGCQTGLEPAVTWTTTKRVNHFATDNIYYWYTERDLNPHWQDFKSCVSAVGLSVHMVGEHGNDP